MCACVYTYTQMKYFWAESRKYQMYSESSKG